VKRYPQLRKEEQTVKNNLKDIEKRVKKVISELLDSSSDGTKRTSARQSPSGNAAGGYDLDASFLELGINSVLAVELVEALNQKLGIELGVEVMFDYKNMRELAQFIFKQYGKENPLKEPSPIETDIQLSEEEVIDSGKNAHEPAVEAESSDNHEVRRDRKRASSSPGIAIIGISGKFADAPNIEALWQHLQAGESCIKEIRRKGWETSAYYDPDPERINTSVSKWGGMLQDIDQFDPLFFNISPLEATRMDPQHRLFLQEAYSAFEDAGYSAEQLSDKKVGVFVGARPGDYKDRVLRLQGIDSHLFLGTDMAILSARISYFLNCKGPSLTIDTACSSALVAIHLACESIHKGESEMALAGGVFILSTPEFYVMTSKTQMLSPDGKCKTFDNAANGIVLGEGVGAAVLKSLEAALQDGDHIYGVILGSGVNQDGKTFGITAPSMLSQKTLLADIYQRAAIHPETVSYIEVHGTGTKLGDPIEFKALTETFRLFTDKAQFCALGSLKPNIGHTAIAAGMAGLFKILMAMKYGQIPPTINIENINQQMDFQESPFFIATELREWKSRAGSPRRAGLSSFGLSGTNSHIIVEEAPPQEKKVQERVRPSYFFPLSAKTKAALKQKGLDLIAWLEREGENASAEDISYTLVQGRSHFSVRLAVVARDTSELLKALRELMSKDEWEYDDENEKRKSSAQIEQSLHAYGNWLLKELSEDTNVEQEEYKEKLNVLVDLYVKRYSLDWSRLFEKGRYHRVPLPTYPFNRESYWIEETSAYRVSSRDQGQSLLESDAVACGLVPQVHPLVQRNTSTLWEQQFSSTFHGDEFFLADHVVAGQRIMPGVAYLEMARAAIEEAMGSTGQDEGRILRLTQIVWARPLVGGESLTTVHIVLSPRENGTIAFLINCDSASDRGQAPSLHCQGRAELLRTQRTSAKQHLDLPAIASRTQQRQLSAREYYQRYHEHGITYGPTLRSVEQLSLGEEEILARFRLPTVVAQTQADYVLHPSVLDAALQACISFLMEQEVSQGPHLPFALEELSLMGEVPTQGWAWVRRMSTDVQAGTNLVTASVFDIDVCDDEGSVAVRLRGLNTRRLVSNNVGENDIASTGKLLACTTLWDPVVLSPQAGGQGPAKRIVIIGGTAEEQRAILDFFPHAHLLEMPMETSSGSLAERLAGVAGISSVGSIEQVFWLAPSDSLLAPTEKSILSAQQEGVLACFRLIKAFLQLGYGSKSLQWTVISHQTRTLHASETANPTHASLLGLFGALAKEYPHWRVQQIDLPIGAPLPLAEMQRLPADPQGHGWLYRNRDWYRQILIPLDVSPDQKRSVYRRSGVYVIIGGAGGIGEVWSEYLIRTYQAQIIWIGRREKNAAIVAKLQRLASMGPVPDYISADATDRQALEEAYQQIKQRYGQIHGVVHSAIVLLDQSLAKMDEERFQEALAAKVDVAVRLAQVFEHEPLDFVLFFSSINAFTRSAGQSNYAAGCTFEDAFAARLRQEWPCVVKVMNWGYWSSVGAVASASYQQRMEQMGLGSLEPAEAMQALEDLLTGPVDQIVLLKTTQPVLPELTPLGELIQTQQILTIYPQYLPSSFHQVVSTHLSLEGQKPSLSETRESMQEIEELLCKLLWSQLQELGLGGEKRIVLSRFREQAGIRASYERWLEESIALLERQHYLHRDDPSATDGGTTCIVSDSPTQSACVSLWQQWEQRKEDWMQNADLKAQVVLVETTLRALPSVLTGKRSAVDVLFPDGSMHLVEGIYQHNVIADSFNEFVARLVVAYLQERLTYDAQARVRILEIGAGTGGTTSRVLQSLQPYLASIAEYCYSDVSEAFLRYGQQTYGVANPFLTYRLVNVEKPLAEQGIGLGVYDLVIATNVLHATSNIRRTVRNAKATLKKHGWLLLNEIIGTSICSHLTFGLLPGWWAYEDPELRVPGGPALSAENWQVVLSDERFGAISTPTQDMLEAGQQIIVAESDGIVRQEQYVGVGGGVGRGGGLGRPHPSTHYPLIEPSCEKTNGSTDHIILDHVQSIILESCAEVLRMQESRIREDTSFSEYGVDSLVGINLINLINQKSHLTLSTTVLFDYDTVERLCQYIVREHSVTLRAWLKEHTQSGEVQSRVGTGLAPVRHTLLTSSSLDDTRTGASLVPTRFSLVEQYWEVASQPQIVPPSHEPIAIIGMSGRFARSKNVSELWEHLAKGTDLVEEVSRWDLADLAPTAAKSGELYCKSGSFLEGIDLFDALFFNISGLEATYMDPQQRLMLEEAWNALEDAGYVGSSIEERQCGVYIGCAVGDYQELFDEAAPAQAFWGNAGSLIPSRIAYYLNLQGPALAIDTSCSSSLVAMHVACQGLWSGEIEMALAGGVFVQSTPRFYQRSNRAGMLSVTGHCYAFDDRADGFVIGEGVGVVVLKRLKDALASGDHIYGVIRGSGMNQDGTTRGITAPSVNAQERLMRSIYETFQIEPALIQMMEAHGTGTKLGDPVEVEALTRVFGKETERGAYCALGSIKSNLGHTVTTAGVAGVIKILLSLQHKQIPPSLHFESGNSHIEWKGSPFYVNTQLQDWHQASEGTPRCAAVSSFGLSGTNAHLVIEQAPEHGCRPTTQPGYLVVLSARTSEQLRQQVEQLATFCEQTAEIDCGNMSYTLLLGRRHLMHRLACVAGSSEELAMLLRRWLEKGKVPQISVANLETREQGETASLRRYGNRCIEECRQTSESEIYLEHLSTIADLYLQGYGLAYERLFKDGEYGRISLPTYPFARKRYWVPTPTGRNDAPRLSMTSGTAAVASPSPIGSVHLRASEMAPLSITQHVLPPEAEERSLTPAMRTHMSGGASNQPKSIALRPLADHRQSPTTLSSSSQPFSQLGGNAVVDPGLAPMTPEARPRATTDMQAALTVGAGLASSLEKELTRSLADALYVEEGDINGDKPFIELGLDSVIGIEWVNSINEQYAITLRASCIYSYPTIRLLAGFLQEELLKQGGRIQQTPGEAMSNLSLEERGASPISANLTEHPVPLSSPKFVPLDASLGLVQGTIPTEQGERAHTVLKGQIEGIGDVANKTEQADRHSMGRKEAVAIVGMSGKYPGAHNLTEYWDNLVQAKDCVREIPLSRFDAARYYDSNPSASGKISCLWLGALDDIEYFDPFFFHLSPAEAEFMDPQHRLFLQEGYKAFEDAGYSPRLLSNRKCGVYLGVMSNEYALLLAKREAAKTSILGTSFAMAAARIAYLLNLKGPAIAIDTACSSSLVATHLACQALWNKEIDMALVGGVSLYLTPDSYIGMCEASMLSPDGRCKTFDASANGFVPGEGVGALVLKRLTDAEADHDQIHGVIIASGINQDGATNGITAPSVRSQIELEREIYGDAQIDPASISYVEMHGTGTKLGDPIELEALATVFQEKTQRKQYCAVGSVKSNLGHTSAAAGVAGVHKVLLAMKQKKLVPTLHFERPNPHFDFAASPFYVNTEVQDWHRVSEGAPRRAAVSAFGFSGTNAHLVVEEYLPSRQGVVPNLRGTKTPILFVLSAQSERQRQSYAQEMKAWIQKHEELALSDIAFTLQVGREAMECRLAIEASSREELAQRLESFIDGRPAVGVYTGQVKRSLWSEANPDLASSSGNDAVLFETDEDGQTLLHTWCRKKKLDKIARVWVRGVNVDWKLLYITEARSTQGPTIEASPTIGASPMATMPYRISLPTYPFARERYWIPTSGVGNGEVGLATTRQPTGSLTATTISSFAPLHPLVQQNISDFFEQRFSSTFSGDEFFLADHVVKGQRVMPGVAYLEMARAAIEQAVRSAEQDEGCILRLSQVVWARPLVIGELPITVHITLTPQEDETIAFLVSHEGPRRVRGSGVVGRGPWSTPNGSPSQTDPGSSLSLLCQGSAALQCTQSAGASQNLDLSAILSRCQHQISAKECYQRYRELGISYGPAFQGIEQLRGGEGEVLARLRLSAAPGVEETSTDYVLHPSVLDAGLQASIVLMEQEVTREPHLPFALEELSIMGKVPTQGWAWVRRRSGNVQTEASPVPASVFDIEVCDDEGCIAVRLRGLSTRRLMPVGTHRARQDTLTAAPRTSLKTVQNLNGIGTPLESSEPEGELLACTPLWDPVALRPVVVAPEDLVKSSVIIGGTAEEQRAILDSSPHTCLFEIPVGASIKSLAERLAGVAGPGFGSIEQVFWLAPRDCLHAVTEEGILSAQGEGVLACFRLIKAFLQLGYGSRTLHWTVITRQTRVLHASETVHPTHASLLGLFGALAKEYPHWVIQQVDLPIDAPLPLAELQRLPDDAQGYGWLYRNGSWYRQILVPLNLSTEQKRSTYRRGGVYVIIGGAGGIGEVWSEYVIRRYQAQVIWIGRRQIDASIEAKQERLAVLGPRPLYLSANATNLSELHQAYQKIKRRFSRIHAVVHSAIVLLDQSLANMDEERFQAALEAKTDVNVRLAQIFEQESLDFVLFFSSLNAFTRNAGQSNYAAGCTFEDAFAARLRQDWPCVVKVMNWGYWGSVGVVASASYQQRMEQMGVGSLEPAEAMQALEDLLSGPVDQMVLLKMTQPVLSGSTPLGELIQTQQKLTVYPEHLPSSLHSLDDYRPPLLEPTRVPVAVSAPLASEIETSREMTFNLEDAVQEALKRTAAEVLEVRNDEIESDGELSEYGFDQVALTELTNRLNQTYHLQLRPTLFLEVLTLQKLGHHLVQSYPDALREYFKPVLGAESLRETYVR
jgi:acyl transferase domain-containing protein/acyl carrier protein/SAM-dependent methyltransferase